jgi:transcription elongation factor GreA
MTGVASDTIWLTRSAHERLTDELSELSRIGAPNPEQDARIRELRALLSRAEIGEKPDDGLVEPGMTITVEFDGDDAPTTFLLGHRGISDIDAGVDVYPPSSPLGSAITGKYPGDTFAYTAPSGSQVTGRVVAAVPFSGS